MPKPLRTAAVLDQQWAGNRDGSRRLTHVQTIGVIVAGALAAWALAAGIWLLGTLLF